MFVAPPAGLPAGERRRLEESFFRRLRLPEGVTKRTHGGRLAALDPVLAAALPRDQRLALMDVAVSSGVTTLDWLASLEAAGFDFHLLAGDLTLAARLVSFHLGGRPWLDALFDGQGRPLQFDLLGRAMPSAVAGPRGALPGLLRAWMRLWRRAIAAAPGNGRGRRFGISSRAVSLVVPELARHPRVEVVEDDLRAAPPAAWVSRFDAVRAANILNRDYFSDSELRALAALLRRRLKVGGLLAVGRNDPTEALHATVFRRLEGDLWQVVGRLGGGSDLDDLVPIA